MRPESISLSLGRRPLIISYNAKGGDLVRLYRLKWFPAKGVKVEYFASKEKVLAKKRELEAHGQKTARVTTADGKEAET